MKNVLNVSFAVPWTFLAIRFSILTTKTSDERFRIKCRLARLRSRPVSGGIEIVRHGTAGHVVADDDNNVRENGGGGGDVRRRKTQYSGRSVCVHADVVQVLVIAVGTARSLALSLSLSLSLSFSLSLSLNARRRRRGFSGRNCTRRARTE